MVVRRRGGGEASLSLWRHHVSGVVGEGELLRRMDVDVRRYVRREECQRSIPDRLQAITPVDDTEADFERLVAALDAYRACVGLDIPEGARAWADNEMRGGGEPLTAAQRMYGLRWSPRARRRLAPVRDG